MTLDKLVEDNYHQLNENDLYIWQYILHHMITSALVVKKVGMTLQSEMNVMAAKRFQAMTRW